MPLLNIFKKQKPKEGQQTEKVPKTVKEAVAASPKISAVKKPGFSEIAHRVLLFPHVTERATDLNKFNQYVFKIYSKANKIEVKKSIEGLYGVEVLSVNIINVPTKQRRLGKVKGFRKGYKKAIVRVKEGQKIEVLPR